MKLRVLSIVVIAYFSFSTVLQAQGGPAQTSGTPAPKPSVSANPSGGVNNAQTGATDNAVRGGTTAAAKDKELKAKCAPCMPDGGAFRCEESALSTGPQCSEALKAECLKGCKEKSNIEWGTIITAVGVAGTLGTAAYSIFGGKGSGVGGGGGSGSDDSSSSGDYAESKTSELFGSNTQQKCGKLKGTEQTKCYCEANGWTFDTAKGVCNDAVATASKNDTSGDTALKDPSLSSSADATKSTVSADSTGGALGGSSSGGLKGTSLKNSDSASAASLRDLAMASRNRIEGGSGNAADLAMVDAANSGAFNARTAEIEKDKEMKKEVAQKTDDIFYLVNQPIRLRYDYKKLITYEEVVQKHNKKAEKVAVTGAHSKRKPASRALHKSAKRRHK